MKQQHTTKLNMGQGSKFEGLGLKLKSLDLEKLSKVIGGNTATLPSGQSGTGPFGTSPIGN